MYATISQHRQFEPAKLTRMPQLRLGHASSFEKDKRLFNKHNFDKRKHHY